MAKDRTIRKIKLSDYKKKKKDEGGIEIELDNGETIRIDPPEIWDDEVLAAAKDDDIEACRLLVGGPEMYELFKASGGSAATLLSMLQDEHGATPGK